MHNISSGLAWMFRRSAAFLYDCLLLIALYFIITAVAVGFNDGESIQHPLFYLFLFIVGFLFFDWFWRHGGQTLGMRAWRIKVEGMEGAPLSFRQSVTRYLTGTLLFGISLLYVPFSTHHLALHDRLSRTKIIRYYN
jgi:uncharacterized RDD family membrane protein YckC